MKKVIIFVLLIVVSVLSFWFCQNIDKQYPFSQPQEEITGIEIVEIKDYRIINKGYYEEIVTKKVLAPTEFDLFLSEFDRLYCREYLNVSPQVVEGAAIRVIYQDGAFDIVSIYSGFCCSADKEWSYPDYYFVPDEFNDFLLYWETKE